MRIVQLQAENVKRLKAVEITPQGELVVIGGRNAQGKTSILDSIEMALAGKSSIPDQPIRRGEEKARVVVTLDDGTTVERNFTSKGSYLTVKRGDGTNAGTPQAMLDSLCSKIAFDPLAFLRAKPAEQADKLRSLVGLDFRAQDSKRKEIYDHRTDINRQVKQAEAAIASMPWSEDAPLEEVSVSGLMAELKTRQETNKATEAARAKLTANETKLEGFRKEAADLEAKLAKLRETIAQGEAWIAGERQRVASLATADTAEIERQIEASETTNRKVRANQKITSLRGEAERLKASADELTRQIEGIDAAKQQAMAEAKWPVAGLGFSDTGVTFNGLPLEQASSAEQLRVSVAIGLAFNPKLKVLLIRDGSLLDSDSLAMVGKMASEAGGQVWVEVVRTGEDVQVVIEDGEVVPKEAVAQEEMLADIAAGGGSIEEFFGG